MPDRSPVVSVPEDASAQQCPYCDRAFHEERHRTLHKGLDHPDRIDDAEREAFQDAYRGETDEIKVFRMKVLGSLVVLYFFLLFAYMVLG
ncbi:DUF7410 domain-containing protein [Natronoarchaeum rubrum]|uniref:DUF7410 domain-containing protein n=1 Tax=Natronoarchaeum rubrum TaxID=755311 RepID=UPI0021126A3C|nr:hypothetical protein [Natronoarchaeum rubrum]HMB49939.1 hypothetical protein [Natronoarchaeum rubrum]